MYKTRFVFTAILLSVFSIQAIGQQSCPKWGPYVKTTKMGKVKAELMMADVMIPADGIAPYTYACTVQFGIGKSGGYCGIQKAGLNEKRAPNNIFSIWDFPNKVQITAAYKDPLTFIGGFGGEGTGLHSHADFGWKTNQWYTNIVRRWTVNDSTTQVGYWIFDHQEKAFRHFVTFTVPEKEAMLHSDMGSFLENFADEKKRARTAVYKSYWMLSADQTWLKPDTLVAEAGEGSWKAVPFGKDGVKVTSCGTAAGQLKYKFAVQQEDRPGIISQAGIYDLSSYYDHSQKKIFVNWSILSTATPQLAYEVQIFDNESCSGSPLASLKAKDPDISNVGLAVRDIKLKKQNYYITLQITDIFGQLSPVRKTILEELKP
ncbi:DUF3472 domain-containing protein [Pedobacter cryoconitis]|uniref:DUF3472 domain-containing protein n=1 Tax=Pedobacter cryoconitis TaxID=188932 RepID=A0A7X0J5V2_9SPHI|nr:DUF3472 domain-containing protein [Pedobacter cryoconitis]MBB6501420.1 hypothetical protein [Pedobacter cryoconitis]